MAKNQHTQHFDHAATHIPAKELLKYHERADAAEHPVTTELPTLYSTFCRTWDSGKTCKFLIFLIADVAFPMDCSCQSWPRSTPNGFVVNDLYLTKMCCDPANDIAELQT